MPDTNDTFRAWLYSTRQSAGMSQQKIADALKAQGFGFRQTTVAKIEHGDRPLRLDEAAAIAAIFGATLDTALGLSPDHTHDFTVARQLAARTSLLTQIRKAINAELDGA